MRLVYGQFGTLAKDSGQGIITEGQLKLVLADPHVQAHLRTLDLDVHEGAALFHLLAAGRNSS